MKKKYTVKEKICSISVLVHIITCFIFAYIFCKALLYAHDNPTQTLTQVVHWVFSSKFRSFDILALIVSYFVYCATKE